MSATSSLSFCPIPSTTDMELGQLAVFAAVAEHRSFSEAARRLYISHSSASRAVSALEKELGIRLLERDNHVLGLTAAGERLLQGSRELLEMAEHLKTEVGFAGEDE